MPLVNNKTKSSINVVMDIDQYRSYGRECVEQLEDITQRALFRNTTLRRAINLTDGLRSHEDSQIYKHLHGAFGSIYEHFDSSNGDPQGFQRTIKIGAYELTVTAVHRGPIEKLTGADVMYHVKDVKVVLFQHKKRHSDGSL